MLAQEDGGEATGRLRDTHVTTRKQAISGAPKRLSVAHGGCATVSSPLKCVFCGACLGAPQKAQVSVAHCTGCATEIF